MAASPNTTITPPGNAVNLITVTAYNQDTDIILSDASRGYSRSNHVKPDFAAPGFEIPCAILGNRYGVLSGTGAAAAHTAGIVAMILEWAIVKGNNPALTGADSNRLLIRGANRKSDMEYPNRTWGYGNIDLFGFFLKLI